MKTNLNYHQLLLEKQSETENESLTPNHDRRVSPAPILGLATSPRWIAGHRWVFPKPKALPQTGETTRTLEDFLKCLGGGVKAGGYTRADRRRNRP